MFKKKKRRSREYKNNSQVIDIEKARQERKRKRDEAANKKNKSKKTKRTVTERQAGKKARRRWVYFFIAFIISVIIGASIFNIVSLKLTEANTLKEQSELLEQKARLESVYSKINNPEYIEQQARQQLKMIKPEEILYVMPEKSDHASEGGIVPN